MATATRNHRVFIIGCISFAMCFILTSGCVDDQEKSPVVMTMREHIQDYVESENNETKVFSGDFKSLEEGDALIIRDAVGNITFDESTSVSYMEFESFMGYPLAFQGNLLYKFMLGDIVEVKVHITKVTFFEQRYDGANWTINLETFREGVDPTDNGFIPLPQQYVSRP